MLNRLLPIALLAFSATAEVTLPAILTEHMVLQRDRPVHLWGKAVPSEAVSISFRGETQQTTANASGQWSLYLAPGQAGGPFDLTIKATNTIAFTDILVGDVWVASGQSNMEFKLRQTANAQTEIAAAKYPKIRRILILKRSPIILWTRPPRSRGPTSTPKTPRMPRPSLSSSRAICRTS